MNKAPSIAVVGSTNIDMVAYTSRAPGPGETVLGDRFEQGFGGKGANQAVMGRLLGAEVAFIGCVGDDAYADITLANFASHGIDTTHVRAVAGSSGVAPIWVEPDGTNRIIVVPAANNKVTAAHAGEALQELPEVSVVIGQFEIPQPATAGAFRAAKARGASTVLNPAPAAPLTPELLAATDWLIPNEGEFSTLAGSEVVTDEAARRFSAEHDIRLLITLGADGVALLALNGQLDRIPAPSVEATDTTGAGDAFVGAFSFGLASGLSDASAARLGILCAADSVIRSGAQSSFPDRDRCRQLLAEASA